MASPCSDHTADSESCSEAMPPGDSKVADVESLEVDGARRVIGHDTVDDTVDLEIGVGQLGVAWAASASAEESLSAAWSEAKPRGYSLNDVVR